MFEVSVNAQSGAVVSRTEQRLTGLASGLFQGDELAAAEADQVLLGSALVALKEDGAQIEEISLGEEDDRWIYEVELRDNKGKRELMTDATTGKVVAD